MRTIRFLLFFVFNSLLSLPVFADENISLEQATALALQANPNIAVVMRGREIESGQQLQAALRPNPVLTGQIQDLRSQNRISSLIVSQQLETAGKRTARIDAAEINMAVADADIAITRAQISAQVYAGFYRVLAAQQTLNLAQDLVQIASQSKEATAKRVLAGKVSPVEETKARVVEAGLKLELAQARQQLVSAKQRLLSLWVTGTNDGVYLNVTQTNFSAVGELENLQELPALPQLMQQLPDSPRLKKAVLNISQTQKLTSIEKSKQTPDVTISLGAQRNEELGGITQAIVGLSIPIPVFDQNKGNLQSAKAREYQVVDEKTVLENQLKTDLVDAYNRRQLQVESINLYNKDILPGAQSAYEAARKGFEFGKFSFLEVLDSQRTLFQAKTQHLQTLALARLAEADIQSILGHTNIKELP